MWREPFSRAAVLVFLLSQIHSLSCLCYPSYPPVLFLSCSFWSFSPFLSHLSPAIVPQLSCIHMPFPSYMVPTFSHWEGGGMRLETRSRFVGSEKTITSLNLLVYVWNRGVRLHRIRYLKQYYFNSIPPTSHPYSVAYGGVLFSAPVLLTRYGRSSKVHVLNVLPDPGALNLCMHTLPEKHVGLLWIYCVFGYGMWDPQFGVLRIEIVRTDRTGGFNFV